MDNTLAMIIKMHRDAIIAVSGLWFNDIVAMLEISDSENWGGSAYCYMLFNRKTQEAMHYFNPVDLEDRQSIDFHCFDDETKLPNYINGTYTPMLENLEDLYYGKL